MWPESHSAKKWAKGQVNLPFYRVAPCTCVAGTNDTGTSPLPRLVKMVALGATICIALAIGLWLVSRAETAYAATMATTHFNLVKKGGGGGRVAREYHDIYNPIQDIISSESRINSIWLQSKMFHSGWNYTLLKNSRLKIFFSRLNAKGIHCYCPKLLGKIHNVAT